MKIRILFGALALVAVLFPAPLFSEGTAFTYQGRLDFDGAAANGNYDFRFAVYDNDVAGNQKGSAFTNFDTIVSDGVFTVTLDFGSVFPGADRWLDISVRTNGNSSFTSLSPRQQLSPTPYAITAENVPSGAGLSGAYGSAVTFSNNADIFAGSFAGNGSTVTNVNAATLNGVNSANLWQLGGNNVAPGQFLGSTNNQPLQFLVNNLQAMQISYAGLSPDLYSPNYLMGVSGNYISNGAYGAVILGGGQNAAGHTNLVLNDFGVVLGGFGNTASGYTSITGGADATASGQYSVALGFAPTASGNGSFALDFAIANGQDSFAASLSQASGPNSTALGDSVASESFAFAAGHSRATGSNSAALGSGQAEGNGSTAFGGGLASGDYSFAAGNAAQANHDGSFVWADASSAAPFTSTGDNQFLIRAQGGVTLDDTSETDLNFGSSTRQMLNLYSTSYAIGVQSSTLYQRSNSRFSWFKNGVHSDTQNDPGTGGTVLMTLTSAGLTVNGTLVSSSDRNAKEDFSPISSTEVLEKVAMLPITKWIYKADPGVPHIGPMAQDFHEAFGLNGEDDKHIATVDEGGIALAAIQGLNEKLIAKDIEIQNLKSQNDSLAQRLSKLEASVERLTQTKN